MPSGSVSTDADAVLHRRRMARRLLFWRIVGIAALLALVLVLAGRLGGDAGSPHVARIDVDDLILSDAPRAEALFEAARDPDVRALIVAINSPGGTVVGGESLYLHLRAAAKQKPVVAVMGELGTSAAYMVALGAERIVARSGTITGSIGVIMQTTEITGLLDKLGIRPETIKSDPMKAQPNPFEPLSDEARAATQAIIDDMHRMFVAMVAERRGLDMESARALGDGRIFTGRQALDAGLIDQLGGMTEAREWLFSAHDISPELPTIDVTPRKSRWEEWGLAEAVFGKTLFSERLKLDGLVSVWHP